MSRGRAVWVKTRRPRAAVRAEWHANALCAGLALPDLVRRAVHALGLRLSEDGHEPGGPARVVRMSCGGLGASPARVNVKRLHIWLLH
ncbi:MAG: hypothetical protein OXG58_06210 [Gemmatimonadetes bacterium]|nr:hypothetical protein [Gemmatimonadota bacterium]MCY3944370.1 hypothetical protein [Gemmatimonadota bacterium]